MVCRPSHQEPCATCRTHQPTPLPGRPDTPLTPLEITRYSIHDLTSSNNGSLIFPAGQSSSALATSYNVETANYPYPHAQPSSVSDSITLHPAPSYNAIPESSDWAYGMQPATSSSYEADRTLTTLMSTGSSANDPPLPSQPWHPAGPSNTEADASAYRTWGVNPSYSTLDGGLASAGSTAFDSALGSSVSSTAQTVAPQYASIELRDGHAWTQPGSPAPAAASYASAPAPTLPLQEAATPNMVAGPQNPPYGESMYASYGQRRQREVPSQAQASTASSSSSSIPPLPGHAYTRTLVGPLSANACRLLDEHRKPGVFFLFQDLSIRTEGTPCTLSGALLSREMTRGANSATGGSVFCLIQGVSVCGCGS